MSKDALKQQAAEQAASMVEDGTVVGLGTGSTAAFFIDALIRRARAGLKVACIPTSERSAAQAREGGLSVVGFDTHRSIDLAVDGADEIKRDTLDLTKGLGGALLREKIVAAAAKRLVIIADAEKLVDWLGERTVIPVEVTRFGCEVTCDKLRQHAAEVTLRIAPDGARYVTDGGNHIADCHFPHIADGGALDRRLQMIPGVVDTGLFIGMAQLALVADEHGVTRYTPR